MKTITALKNALGRSFGLFVLFFKKEMDKDKSTLDIDKAIKGLNKHLKKEGKENLIPKSRLNIMNVDYKTGFTFLNIGVDLYEGTEVDDALIEISNTMKEYRLNPDKQKDEIKDLDKYLKTR